MPSGRWTLHAQRISPVQNYSDQELNLGSSRTGSDSWECHASRSSTVLYRSSLALRIALFNRRGSLPYATLLASTVDVRIPVSRLELCLQLQKAHLAKKAKGDTGEVMSALLQFSNVRYAVIQLSSAKGSPERLVLAYPNEETLRSLIADTCIVGLGFSSRDEAACDAGAAVTQGATPRQADGVAGSHAEEKLVHHLRERLAHRMKFLPIRRLARPIVQLGIAAAIFIFHSKNIVSATVRAVLAGSV